MSSEGRIVANRRNARKSTGPRSQAGKDRAAKNALTHGLTTSITGDARRAVEIETLAREIAGSTTELRILECARAIAAAGLELDRVRRIRVGLIKGAFAEQAQERSCEDKSVEGADESMENAVRNVLPTLQRILRYERRAVAKRDKALRRLVQVKLET